MLLKGDIEVAGSGVGVGGRGGGGKHLFTPTLGRIWGKVQYINHCPIIEYMKKKVFISILVL